MKAIRRGCSRFIHRGSSSRSPSHRAIEPVTKSAPRRSWRHITSYAVGGTTSSLSAKASSSPVATSVPALRAAPSPWLSVWSTRIRSGWAAA